MQSVREAASRFWAITTAMFVCLYFSCLQQRPLCGLCFLYTPRFLLVSQTCKAKSMYVFVRQTSCPLSLFFYKPCSDE